MKPIATLLGGAAIVAIAGFASAASATPVEFRAGGLGAINSDFFTSGGTGTVNNYLDFGGTSSSPGQLGSGEMIIDITSFADATGTGVGSSWQLFAVVSNLASSGGTWHGVNFDGTTGTLSGTIDIYGIAGHSCGFSNTDISASITGCVGSPTLLGDGVLSSGSYLQISGNNGNQKATETFELLSDLTSDSADMLPSGLDAIALTVSSGLGGSPTTITAFDPALDYGTGDCTTGSRAVCTPGAEPVSWDLADPAPDPVPEPASLSLFVAGLFGLAAARRRKRG